jgi:hypothetical protein
LALWLILQLLPLLAAAAQLPLSDQFPRPAEQLALDELIVVQITASALLFPLILPTLPSTLIAIAASWPFLQLAGFLAAAPPLRVLGSACYLALWLLTLNLWLRLLPHRKSLLIGVAIATTLALAGPLLWYLKAEFGMTDSPAAAWPIDSRLGPVMGGLAMVHGGSKVVPQWLPVCSLCALGGVFSALARFRPAKLPGKP